MAPESHRGVALTWISWISLAMGALLVVGGAVTYVKVHNELAAEQITVAADASCLAGHAVQGPFTAYCQAEVISKHALEFTGGKTYAQLGQNDPLRQTAMTASFLRASLFTSVVAFGVAAFAFLVGVLFMLLGIALRVLSAPPAASPPPPSPPTEPLT